jgi:hypothetical protein
MGRWENTCSKVFPSSFNSPYSMASGVSMTTTDLWTTDGGNFLPFWGERCNAPFFEFHIVLITSEWSGLAHYCNLLHQKFGPFQCPIDNGNFGSPFFQRQFCQLNATLCLCSCTNHHQVICRMVGMLGPPVLASHGGNVSSSHGCLHQSWVGINPTNCWDQGKAMQWWILFSNQF